MMAQPGSHNTTPSPVDADEQAQRQKAIDTFLARTEFSKLARVLRARLSYASYKATHNVAHVPLTSLESELASRPTPPEPARKLNHTTTMPPPGDNRLLRSAGMSLYQAVLDPGPAPNRRSRNAPGRDRLAVPGRTVRNSRRRHAVSTEREDINAATTLTAIMRAGASTPLSRTSSASSVPSRTPQPDDAQAAELMLFLATSPSPARATPKPAPGLGLAVAPRAQGRVLFPDGEPRMLFPDPQQLPTPEPSQAPVSPQRSFNLGDYINVSPGPQGGYISPSPAHQPAAPRSNVPARRLFD